MKKIVSLLLTLCATLCLSAETITACYYGAEIDLSQKSNPCKGNTNGGVKVIVITNVESVKDTPQRTVVERTYKLPDGEILKKEREIVNSPKYVVLHDLFPFQFPKIKY